MTVSWVPACLDSPPESAQLTDWPHAAAGEFERLPSPATVPLAFLLQRLADEQPAATAHLDLSCDDREHRLADRRPGHV